MKIGGLAMTTNSHIPVLLDEIGGFLLPRSGGVYVDATVGGGGHAEKILDLSSPDGRLIGIDLDPAMLEIAKGRLGRFGERCDLVEGNYTELEKIVDNKVDGIIFDLGVSTEHFKDSHRGFSFVNNGPLDMRFGPRIKLTAEEIVNRWRPEDLTRVLYNYGEEREAKKIVRVIVEARKKKRISTTGELAELIIKAIGGRKGKIHPATRTFQALRIAVNNELINIGVALPVAIDLLKPQGRLCVISYHSLEDRLVKNIFRDLQNSKIKIITKKPVTAAREEVINNPRARSAKLRVAERIYGQD